MNKLLIASNNAGKVNEIKSMLPHLQVFSLKDAGIDVDVVEDKDSFSGNALKKAQEIAKLHPEYWVLADDSGLCCNALNGAPGIYTARYAGENATNADNIEKLLKALKDENDRSAHFFCALAFCRDGLSYVFEGKVDGQIAHKIEGDGGFGYDPVFIPTTYQNTFAELDSGIKKKISHRNEALKKFMAFIADD